MRSLPESRRIPRRQRGVVLLIALIMLVALSLGGLALFRQVTGGVLIASNLTFKNAALSGADLGVEAARRWLLSQTVNALSNHAAASGYYASWCAVALDGNGRADANNDGNEDDCKASPTPSVFDPLTYNWANSVNANTTDTDGDGVNDEDGNGNNIRYVIHRLCETTGTAGSAAPNECVRASSTSSTAGRSMEDDRDTSSNAISLNPYYRVTVRVTGPRNTVAYSQVNVY